MRSDLHVQRLLIMCLILPAVSRGLAVKFEMLLMYIFVYIFC